jgi:hypothetical protein
MKKRELRAVTLASALSISGCVLSDYNEGIVGSGTTAGGSSSGGFTASTGGSRVSVGGSIAAGASAGGSSKGGSIHTGGTIAATTSGGSSSSGGAASTGGLNSGGVTAVTGGASTTGGSSAQGGTQTSLATAAGGAETGGELSSGGVPTTGGAFPFGGNSTSGGASPSGGAISTGGVLTTGGSSPGGGTAPTGGVPTTGGAPALGGTAPTGGAPTSGGTSPTGGAPASGGTVSTGGVPPTGGAPASGGSCSQTGGTSGFTACDSGSATTVQCARGLIVGAPAIVPADITQDHFLWHLGASTLLAWRVGFYQNEIVTQLGAFTSVATATQPGNFQLALYADDGTGLAPGSKLVATDTIAALGGDNVCTNHEIATGTIPPYTIATTNFYWIALLVTGSTDVTIVAQNSGQLEHTRCNSPVSSWPTQNPTTSSDCAPSGRGTYLGAIPYLFALTYPHS